MSNSEYRVSCATQPNDGSSQSQLAQPSQMDYAKAIQTDSFPKKEQAIVIDSIKGYQVKDYITEIAKYTSPTNLRFVSRISNERICIYLSTKAIADELIDNGKSITINNEQLDIRPLITRAKRIIISNVCPVIPHSVLEKTFTDLNIKLESKITFIKAGITEPGFAHILSFRRQVYVNLSDIPKIPESLKITFEDTTYWLYFSTDTLKCFLCKEEGHLARNCPKQQQTNDDNTTQATTLNDIPIIPVNVNTDQSLHVTAPIQVDNVILNFTPENLQENQMQIEPTKLTFKRPLSSQGKKDP